MSRDAIEIETAPDPTASMIILHGLGADGSDFVPVAHELDLGPVGPVRFVFPHAPVRPVTINNGYVMPAWYDIFGLDGQDPREDETGLRRSQALVEALIAREKARGIAARRIVLAGFSQGCAMTLMTGLRHAERLAGLVGMSGYLPLAAKAEAERHDSNRDVPIFMAHGTQDPVVPYPLGDESRQLLEGAGYPVEWHSYPMPHGLCEPEVRDIRAFIARIV